MINITVKRRRRGARDSFRRQNRSRQLRDCPREAVAPAARLGGLTAGAQVKVSEYNGGAGYYDVKNSLAAVSQDVQARELTIEIADFETLEHLETVPLELAKR